MPTPEQGKILQKMLATLRGSAKTCSKWNKERIEGKRDALQALIHDYHSLLAKYIARKEAYYASMYGAVSPLTSLPKPSGRTLFTGYVSFSPPLLPGEPWLAHISKRPWGNPDKVWYEIDIPIPSALLQARERLTVEPEELYTGDITPVEAPKGTGGK